MANVKTFNLTIHFRLADRTWRGISRVAVKRYIERYKSNEHYTGYRVEER